MDNAIILGDCSDVLPTLPDSYFRACITSTPYAEQRIGLYGGIPEADFPAWSVRWMAALSPKLTSDGSVLLNIRPHLKNGILSDYVLKTRLALREAGWCECEELIWLKRDAPPLGSILRPRRAWESILWFSRTNKPFIDLYTCGLHQSKRVGAFFGSTRFDRGTNMPVHAGQSSRKKIGRSRVIDVFPADIGEIDKNVDHPAMFPVTLADQLVLTFSAPGDAVIDAFCGSGTVCKSAGNLGRRFIGIENNPEYVEIARRRADPILYFKDRPEPEWPALS